MAQLDDPFERVVTREINWRRRAAMLDASAGGMRLALITFGVLAIGWGVVLVGHWLLLPHPHWLVVLHTIGYVLTVGFWGVTAIVFSLMRRARPDIYG